MADTAKGWALRSMEIEPHGQPRGEAVTPTVTRSVERAASRSIGAVSGGWPRIRSDLKSLPETAAAILLPVTVPV